MLLQLWNVREYYDVKWEIGFIKKSFMLLLKKLKEKGLKLIWINIIAIFLLHCWEVAKHFGLVLFFFL